MKFFHATREQGTQTTASAVRQWTHPLHPARFASALELEFREHRLAQTRLNGPQLLLLSLVYLSLIVSELFLTGASVARLSFVYLIGLGPLLVLAIVRRRYGSSVEALRQPAWALTLLLASLATLRLNHHEPIGSLAFSQIGLLAILAAATLIIKLPFRISIVGVVLVSVLDVIFILPDYQLPVPSRIAATLSVLAVAALMLAENYSSELQARLSFLNHRRTLRHTELLAAANNELDHRSRHDALTGLANRAAFDTHLQALWREAGHTLKPLAAVVIDIDHFKVVNDTQGHLFGDEVLKRVGALLLQSMRGKRDFVARYGGEEFVLLLPDSTAEAASIVAERIRSIVQIAGSPAPADESQQLQGLYTTVSCGVASMIPTPNLTPRDLIARADKALYSAKASGRNRVVADDASLQFHELIAGWS